MAVADDRDAHALTRAQGLHLRQVVLVGSDRRALDRRQHVAADEILLALHDDRQIATTQAGAVGRATVVHDLDEVPRSERELEDRGQLAVDLAALQAEPRADHATRLAELAQHRLGGVDRQGEADRVRLLGDERVDAHDGATAVDQRPAGVAGVDRRIRLDHRLLREARQETIEPAHDSPRHRLLEADRVSDRHDFIAHAQRARIAEARGRDRRRGLDAQQRQVGHRVHPHQPGRRARARVERDRERGGTVDDVSVGQHLTVALDHDAGADHGFEPALGLGLVDLGDLDRDDGRRDALEERREGVRAGLRDGDSRHQDRQEQEGGHAHHAGS